MVWHTALQSPTSHTMGSITLGLAILGCVLVCQASRSSHSREQERHSRLSLLKEISNKIDHGPAYVSHHKGDLTPTHQVLTKHAWKHNKKTGLTKKSKKGSHGTQQPANTRFDQDNIHLQRLDYQPITRKKKMPKNFKQMMKKKSQKPSKKMDKMYKKMIEKEKQRLKKKYLKKTQKKHVP